MTVDRALSASLVAFGLLGHGLMWIEFVNHAHATRMPRWAVWTLTLLGYGLLTLGPLLLVALWLAGGLATTYQELYPVPQYYSALCVVAAIILTPLAVMHRRPPRLSNARLIESDAYDLGRSLPLRIEGGALARLMNYVPGNQVLQLEVTRKEVRIPELPAELDGLRLCHLTDLHFTGRIPRRYFDEVVERANGLAPDLMLITGDLIDKPRCLEWLRPTLGRLRAEFGCYYILGNHDKRVPIDRVRSILAESGLTSVSSRALVFNVRGGTILLAGNELPWLPPAANMAHGPILPGERPHLRLLLSHSPDQLAWARAYRFDLVLAGHNHGGQIALPVIGPVAVPSRYGVKYASGLFYEAPTLMHVSRGVSSELPIRLNCPPELAVLEVRRAALEADATAGAERSPRDR